jgi:hypothetical protein
MAGVQDRSPGGHSMVERTFLPSLFLGLTDLVVLAADEEDGELFILVESTVDRAFCLRVHDRADH